MTYSRTLGSRPVRCFSSETKLGLGRNRTSTTMSASRGMPYLYPKEMMPTWRFDTSLVRNLRTMVSRSWWTVNWEGLRTVSAISRRGESTSRSPRSARQVHDFRKKHRREVVDAEIADVLEHLRRRALSRSGHAGHDDDAGSAGAPGYRHSRFPSSPRFSLRSTTPA